MSGVSEILRNNKEKGTNPALVHFDATGNLDSPAGLSPQVVLSGPGVSAPLNAGAFYEQPRDGIRPKGKLPNAYICQLQSGKLIRNYWPLTEARVTQSTHPSTRTFCQPPRLQGRNAVPKVCRLRVTSTFLNAWHGYVAPSHLNRADAIEIPVAYDPLAFPA